MALSVPQTKSFVPAPAGSHVVRLFQMIDLGMQDFIHQGQTSRNHKIYLSFELPEELMENGQPFIVGKEVILSLASGKRDSMLLQMATALINKQLTGADLAELKTDLFKLNGKYAIANIVHRTAALTGNVRAEIVSLTPLMKGMNKPVPVNEEFTFSLEQTVSQAHLDKIPAFLRRKISLPQNEIGLAEHNSTTRQQDADSIHGL